MRSGSMANFTVTLPTSCRSVVRRDQKALKERADPSFGHLGRTGFGMPEELREAYVRGGRSHFSRAQTGFFVLLLMNTISQELDAGHDGTKRCPNLVSETCPNLAQQGQALLREVCLTAPPPLISRVFEYSWRGAFKPFSLGNISEYVETRNLAARLMYRRDKNVIEPLAVLGKNHSRRI